MVPETTPENFRLVGILCSALQRFQNRVKINFSNANYLAIRARTELNFFQIVSGIIYNDLVAKWLQLDSFSNLAPNCVVH